MAPLPYHPASTFDQVDIRDSERGDLAQADSRIDHQQDEGEVSLGMTGLSETAAAFSAATPLNERVFATLVSLPRMLARLRRRTHGRARSRTTSECRFPVVGTFDWNPPGSRVCTRALDSGRARQLEPFRQRQREAVRVGRRGKRDT